MSTFTPYDPKSHNADNQGNDLEPPPDGTYGGCTLRDAGAFTAKSSGKDFVKFEWETTDGYRWTVLQGFKSDAQTAVTWSEVSKLGINPTEIADLDQLDRALKACVGGYYDIVVKTNGQFRNSYVNGPSVGSNPVVQQTSAAASAATSPASTDDMPWDAEPSATSSPPQMGDLNEHGEPMKF